MNIKCGSVAPKLRVYHSHEMRERSQRCGSWRVGRTAYLRHWGRSWQAELWDVTSGTFLNPISSIVKTHGGKIAENISV